MQRLAVDVRPLAEDEIGVLETSLRRYTTETHRDRFAEQARGDTTYLVAWVGDQPAGYARLKWQPTFMMSLALRDTPTIGDVTVRPDLRSQGVGNQIMQAAEDLVRSTGFSRLALGVEIDNARAIDFYHRRGYFDAGIPPDRTNRYLLGEGELWHEGDRCLCLVKNLKAEATVLAVGRAKVNLALSVGRRRRDGFHSVKTVLQSVSLADEIEVGHSRGVSIRWAAGWEGDLPAAPDLVEKALRSGSRRSAKLRRLGAVVLKRIPLGAGLGGGSADAAAVLRVCEFLDPSTFTSDVLLRQARRLGTDVPFCFQGGTAAATGKGDRLKSVASRKRLWWVVGFPEFTLSTEDVYRRFDSLAAKPGQGATPPGVSGLIKALEAGDLNAIGGRLQNDLEPPAFDLQPRLQWLKRTMLAAGSMGAVMTGSGSAIIGLCETGGEAAAVAQKVRPAFSRVEVTVSTSIGAEVVGSRSRATARPVEAVKDPETAGVSD